MAELIIGDDFDGVTCLQLVQKIKQDVYIICNGRIVDADHVLEAGKAYRICQRLRGGKGGFGSMLRTIGAQIEKTTNRESMRDLSGRRMRDINNEKKLAEWVAGAADRERAREEKRKERLEKRKAEAEGRMHKFRDERYMEQKEAVANNLDDALTQGLKRTATGGETSAPVSKKGKGKAPATSMMIGMGLDLDDLSSSDDEEDESPSRPQSSDDSVTGGSEAKLEINSASPSCSDTHMKTTEPHSNPIAASQDESPVSESEKNPRQEVSESIDADINSSKVEILNQSSSPKEKTNSSNDTSINDLIDIESHGTAEELEKYGLEHLKNDLIRRGLKCGGSLQERAARLYSVRGLSNDEIDPSMFAKKGKGKKV